MIKWAELIPVMFGGYSVGMTEVDGKIIPDLCDTEEEVLAEIDEMQAEYDEQILNGDRDEGDTWEGESHRVWWDKEELFIVDEHDKPMIRVDWRAQL